MKGQRSEVGGRKKDEAREKRGDGGWMNEDRGQSAEDRLSVICLNSSIIIGKRFSLFHRA
jgi:hypothetical protein